MRRRPFSVQEVFSDRRSWDRPVAHRCVIIRPSPRFVCWLLAATISFSTAPAQTLDEFFQRDGSGLERR